MARQNIRVPFGYEPPSGRESVYGSLWVYDTFADFTEQDLLPLLKLAEERHFAKAVFYPLHEETWRRMDKSPVAPYHRRVEALQELLEASVAEIEWTIDQFEGKRKKYTPMDAAFRFLEEKYHSPYFVYVTETMAQKLAGYDGFEPWLKKVRMLIAGKGGAEPHPLLAKHANRWEWV